MIRKWQQNAFWNNADKTQAKAILKLTNDEGVTTSQVVTINKLDAEGNINPDWEELLNEVDEQTITNNTVERENRKTEEKRARDIEENEHHQAVKLEKLFNAKLEAFEIEEIKLSSNRELKTRLRRAKSIVEVNLYAMMIMMEVIENESTEE